MLIISILNNFVKEKDPGRLNPRCAAPPPPLSPWACLREAAPAKAGERDSLPAGRQG